MTRRNIRWLLYGVTIVILGIAGLAYHLGNDTTFPAAPAGSMRDRSTVQPLVSPIRHEAPPRKATGVAIPEGG